GRILPPPPSVEIEGHDEYEVESLLDSRIRYRKLEYLVKWLGYDEAEWRSYTEKDILTPPVSAKLTGGV
ncbi:hypothetical protein BGX24_004858, partial [Mortierella sp. AD032]